MPFDAADILMPAPFSRDAPLHAVFRRFADRDMPDFAVFRAAADVDAACRFDVSRQRRLCFCRRVIAQEVAWLIAPPFFADAAADALYRHVFRAADVCRRIKRALRYRRAVDHVFARRDVAAFAGRR